MTTWLLPLAGVVVLGLLAADVFQTVFHAEGRGGPVNQRQNRLIWGAVRWAGTRGGVRPSVLSLAGPIMAVVTIVVWALLLVVGFGLMYAPFIADFHYSPGTPGGRLLETFYYSGIVVSTLGHGDVVAPVGWLRALTVVQALAGFAALTVGVTYILAIYRELIHVQSLAATIDALFAARPDDAPAERFDAPASAPGDPEVRGRRDSWDRSLALGLTHAVESHHNYPILHYFRPSRRERALPYQVARLLRLEGGVEAGSSELADSASAGVLAAVLRRYVREVHTLFVKRESVQEEGEGDGGTAVSAHAARINEILSMLEYPTPLED